MSINIPPKIPSRLVIALELAPKARFTGVTLGAITPNQLRNRFIPSMPTRYR